MVRAHQRQIICAVILGGLALMACAKAQTKPPAATDARTPGGWQLVWSDEFTGPDGSAPDPTKWVYALGGGGWGNNELQTYTDTRENSFIASDPSAVDGKALVIRGARTAASGYTSARLRTLGRYETSYGRIEARAKLPGGGQGLWPAFWMLGNDHETAGWPACGEIDIMENKGSQPSQSSSALHGPGYSGSTPLHHTYGLAHAQRFPDTYHVFAVEWQTDAVRFFVDGDVHYTVTRDDVQGYGRWVYDHPFYILVNLAIGGSFDGNPTPHTVFPAEYRIDYLRVYHDPAGTTRERVAASPAVRRSPPVSAPPQRDDGASG